MTHEVVVAGEDMPFSKLVDMFDRFNINHVPVVRDDRIVGIISRSDVLRPFAALKGGIPEPSKRDDFIRAELERILHEAVRTTDKSITFEVNGGVVRLNGLVGSEAEREALCVAAEGIPGVRAVEAELALVPRTPL